MPELSRPEVNIQGVRRFKPYPAYKESGVEWLGEIPVGWQALKLKRVCKLAYGESLPSDARMDGDVEVYGSNGPVGTHERANTLAPCLVIGRKGSFGKVNFSFHTLFAIDTTFFVDSRFTRADIRWLYYVLSSAQLDSATKDSAIPGLDREDAYAREVCLCSPKEQRAIAAFLDRETVRIDKLLAKKERLIELLQEKRTALITRAVTKGLDPSIPMKESGVEWLGEIPTDWEVKRLKHILRRQKGAIKTGPFGSQLQSAEMLSGEIKVYNQRSVLDGDFTIGENYISLQKFKELSSFETYPGDLLITTRGSIGRCAILPAGAERGVLHPCLMRIQSDQREISTRFLEVLVQDCGIVLDQLRLMSNATTIDVIYSESLKEVLIVVPPLKDQDAILAFLDRETARIDALVAKVREAIDRLKELRTALISAAVSGKIDVREEAA
jgi:type I restriction enzyme S subunit